MTSRLYFIAWLALGLVSSGARSLCVLARAAWRSTALRVLAHAFELGLIFGAVSSGAHWVAERLGCCTAAITPKTPNAVRVARHPVVSDGRQR